MTTYRSKPTTIEAVQWTGDNANEVRAFLGGTTALGWEEHPTKEYAGNRNTLMLRAGVGGAQGFVPVPIGHWIVRNPGDHSDYWPVDPDYFAAKYEVSA